MTPSEIQEKTAAAAACIDDDNSTAADIDKHLQEVQSAVVALESLPALPHEDDALSVEDHAARKQARQERDILSRATHNAYRRLMAESERRQGLEALESMPGRLKQIQERLDAVEQARAALADAQRRLHAELLPIKQIRTKASMGQGYSPSVMAGVAVPADLAEAAVDACHLQEIEAKRLRREISNDA